MFYYFYCLYVSNVDFDKEFYFVYGDNCLFLKVMCFGVNVKFERRLCNFFGYCKFIFKMYFLDLFLGMFIILNWLILFVVNYLNLLVGNGIDIVEVYNVFVFRY